MARCTIGVTLAALLTASPLFAQTTGNPFPAPIEAVEGLVVVRAVEFAALPDVGGQAARMMLLVDEPGTRRLFVNDMRGPLYSVSYDGQSVAPYVDINDPRWGVDVEAGSRERGFQSFAFHPQFGQQGTPGYGKFYTWTDTRNNQQPADFRPGGGSNPHHTVLLEWTARDAGAATYDGGLPRELMRFEQPYSNHNAGMLAFNPVARPGDADFGLLYVGSADGGSGGDPLGLAQNLESAFGKVLRIDPLGSNSANGRYGVPASNPFAGQGQSAALGEIYAYGLRNPQRFGWDRANGNLFLADIGQSTIEKVTLVPAGANLGWNLWEGSFRFAGGGRGGGVNVEAPRSDPGVTYPVVEYDQQDALLMNSSAVTGVHVYRSGPISQLRDLVLFGDFPSGEIFYFHADRLPQGGQDGIRRVLLNDGSGAGPKTFLQIIREKNTAQGRSPVNRTDLRFGAGPDGQVFLLNKHDGTIRLLVPDR